MGSRDYRWREPKKPKKRSKKAISTAITPRIEVEVIRKGKKTPPPEE